MDQQQKLDITRRSALQGSLSAGVAAALPVAAVAATAPAISATINAARTGEPITKYIYGALIEEIGNLINYSLWAEVLDDRKFYYAVNSAPMPASARGGNRGQGNKWTPIGPDSSVTMDTAAPYAGDHSPVVALAGSDPRGFKQDGLSLVKGKDYSGRTVVAADPGAGINVTLIWGDGPADRQSVSVSASRDWSTQPLKFTSGGDTTNGRMEITGMGTGSFKVGAVSLMPADNLKGFRADTITLLKGLDSGFYRFPGGNFVSGYNWEDTVGDPDRRPPIFDHAWNAAQPNDVGLHELMTMCDLLGVEPYLCISTGFDSPRDCAALLQYVNGAATTPMGRRRAENGHPEPFGVKFWNVGNEMYGPWQIGHMAIEHYTIKHNQTVKAMRKVDPDIMIIASGAMPDEMTVTRAAKYIDTVTRDAVVKVQAEFGTKSDWTGMLLQDCYGNFDLIAEHCYGDAQRFDVAQGKRVVVNESVLDSARGPANRIRLKREYWEQYKTRFPALKDGKIKISVDEWGYRNATGLKQGLGLAMSLHEMFRNTDLITMAGFTMGMSWIDYDRTRSTYSVAGVIFDLYNKNFGRIPVEITGNAPQPPPTWPVGGDQPRVNAGSPTYPLDMSAALKNDGKTLTVAAINATEASQSVALNIEGFRHNGSGRMWRLTGPSLAAINKVGQPPQVTVKKGSFNPNSKSLSVAPYSIEIYEFSIA